MGGLTALMLANAHPDRVLSFTDIEGNISPEDCFLSRQIVEHADPDPDAYFDAFIDRTRHQPAYASALYAASLRHKVRAGAVRGIFSSMVDLSDHGELMEKLLRLPCPKMFMYGDQNASLSYLDHIEANGVRLSQIPDCGHFPMYSNPPEMWREIAEFVGERRVRGSSAKDCQGARTADLVPRGAAAPQNAARRRSHEHGDG
jgi:pimeloyl-ACP methyl ester carboxylesterase